MTLSKLYELFIFYRIVNRVRGFCLIFEFYLGIVLLVLLYWDNKFPAVVLEMTY